MKATLWAVLALSSTSKIVDASTPWGSATTGPPPARTALPQGWSEHMDPSSGQPYYYNAADGTTTWDRPLQTPMNETTSTSSNILNERTLQEQDVTQDAQATPSGSLEAASGIPSTSGSFDEKSPGNNHDSKMSNEGDDTPVGLSLDGERSPPIVDSQSADTATTGADSSAKPLEEKENNTPPNGAWAEQQQPDPRNGGWNMEPQQQQGGPWGMPPRQSAETPSQQAGWNLPNRSSGQEAAKSPTLVDDRRASQPELPNDQQPFDPSKMQQRPPIGQQQIPRDQEFWRGQPQYPPGYRGYPPDQRQRPPQQYQREASQQQQQPQRNCPQQMAPPQHQPERQQGVPQQQQGFPQGGSNQPPNMRPVQRIPERQPQRPPPPGQYGGPPNQGFHQFDGAYPGQQYYNLQQQQQQQYGNQYNPYGQSGSREIATQPPQMAGVKESLGKTWQSVLGFGNRTKEALSTARDTVASNARDAGQTITTKSTGWWGQAKNALGSVFESNSKGESEYSMTGIYGNNDGLQGNRIPPQGYGGQPYGYPQQQGGRPQNYPPPYPGRPNIPPQPPGSSQMPPQPQRQQGQQPPQQQGQRPQRPGLPPQQQGQYPPPGPRYPPGYNPPNPKSDPPYAYQQPQRPGSPQQSQWGLPGQGPMGQSGPYGPPPTGQNQDQNKKNEEQNNKQEPQNGSWQHPGLGPDGY